LFWLMVVFDTFGILAPLSFTGLLSTAPLDDKSGDKRMTACGGRARRPRRCGLGADAAARPPSRGHRASQDPPSVPGGVAVAWDTPVSAVDCGMAGLERKGCRYPFGQCTQIERLSAFVLMQYFVPVAMDMG
jgi:hypothetical protein